MSCCSCLGVLTKLPAVAGGGISLQSQGLVAGLLWYSSSALISGAGEGLCSEQLVSWGAGGFLFQFILSPSLHHTVTSHGKLCEG